MQSRTGTKFGALDWLELYDCIDAPGKMWFEVSPAPVFLEITPQKFVVNEIDVSAAPNQTRRVAPSYDLALLDVVRKKKKS